MLSLPFTLLAVLRGVLAAATLPCAPTLPFIPLPSRLYLLSTLAACELNLLFAMLANGHPSLLGLPSTVKSCSSGDSDIEGIAQLDPSCLSADGPDQIFTPSGCTGNPYRRLFAAAVAVLIISAASLRSLFSKISEADVGRSSSSLCAPGEDDRLRGGVAKGPEPYSFASSLYCWSCVSACLRKETKAGEEVYGGDSQSQFESLAPPQRDYRSRAKEVIITGSMCRACKMRMRHILPALAQLPASSPELGAVRIDVCIPRGASRNRSRAA